MRRLCALAAALILSITPLTVIAVVAAGPAQASATCATGNNPADVNGDGFSDVVAGDPTATVSTAGSAGDVVVRLGLSTGAGTGAQTVLTEPDADATQTADAGDRFGAVVAMGWVDGDHCADVVVATPDDSVDGQADAGSVQVIFGSPDGLGQGRPGLTITEATAGLGGAAVAGEKFGTDLALTDALGPGDSQELAIGIPRRTVAGFAGAGAVGLVGFATDGSVSSAQLVSQSTADVIGASEAGDAFGTAVDFDRDLDADTECPSQPDGCENLLVGVPGENSSAGDVLEIDTAVGAPPYASFAVSQDSSDVPGTAEAGDRFGASLDYHVAFGSGDELLAIGIPGEDVGSIKDAGSVQVFDDEDGNGAPAFTQNTSGIAGAAEAGDQFGTTVLITEDTHRQPYLVVGSPLEDVGTLKDAGGVSIIPLDTGQPATGDVVLSQDSAGIVGAAAAGEHFGQALGNTGGHLLIGVPDDVGYSRGLVDFVGWTTALGKVATVGTAWEPASGNGFGASIAGPSVFR
jgi:hypothetical protein